MKTIAAALISSCSLALLAGTAAAEDFTFEFAYQPSQSAEDNYTALKGAAQRACTVDVRTAGGLRAKTQIEDECTTNLLDHAIVQIGEEGLLALHEEATSTPRAQLYARLK